MGTVAVSCPKNFPIGVDSFREIRETDRYYVDKTELIGRIADSGAKVTLITRPRRFGKTLNLDMLGCFFDMKYAGNTWFDGLKISETDSCDDEKTQTSSLRFI